MPALFIILSGLAMCLALAVGTPSFWYLGCGALWVVSGVLWLFRPVLGASFLIAPLLGLSILLIKSAAFREPTYLIFLATMIWAMLLTVAALRKSQRLQPLALSLSVLLVLGGFGVDRLFTNKLSVKTEQMEWTANGSAPWGEVARDSRGNNPLVVYRKEGNGYCYDAIFDGDLSRRLLDTRPATVTVQYNEFRAFGTVRGYNVRSIAGTVFNDGYNSVRSEGEGYSGAMEAGSGHSPDCH
jgi:hypothetical protein